MRLDAPMPIAELRKLLAYDAETGVFTWLLVRHPNTHRIGTQAGRVNRFGYRQIKLRRHFYMEHRLAWYMTTGDWPTSDIDHVNCDRADNRMKNLRLASVLQNAGNRRSTPGSSSRFKGVTWNSRCQKWQAQIGWGGKTLYLGLHPTEEAASAAYQAAASELFGKFARAA